MKNDVRAFRDDSFIYFSENNDNSDALQDLSTKAGYLYCPTQRRKVVSAMVRSGNSNEFGLWKKNSALKCRIVDETFQTQEQFSAVEFAMRVSTEAWNQITPGGVTFERGNNVEEATSRVKFMTGGGNKEVVGFFPEDYVPGVSALNVYEFAFRPENQTYLADVICHELGHILGFRHEFELYQQWQAKQGIGRAWNPLSIMLYSYPPRFSPRDIIQARGVYTHVCGSGQYHVADDRGRGVSFSLKAMEAIAMVTS